MKEPALVLVQVATVDLTVKVSAVNVILIVYMG